MAIHTPQPNDKLVVILGTTASGKSSLAIHLAEKFTGEIVIADSLQVYKGMDLGTAKVTAAKQALVPYHLLDIRRPDQEFTVAEYQDLAFTAINDILRRGLTPFMEGGTGLYIQAVVDNLTFPRVPPDSKFRQALDRKLAAGELKPSDLYKTLLEQDPQASFFVEPHNTRRIIRALEVIHLTGKKLSGQRAFGPPRYDSLQIGLGLEIAELKKRIHARTENMFEQGLIEETRNIIKKHGRVKPLEAMGYREVLDLIDNKITSSEARELIELHTLQLAKRQLKWFKRDQRIKWITESWQAEVLVARFLKAGQ